MEWSWVENQKFLDNAIENNDVIRAVSYPHKAENLFEIRGGKLTNELSIYGQEIKYLEDAGYRFHPISNTFEKGFKSIKRNPK